MSGLGLGDGLSRLQRRRIDYVHALSVAPGQLSAIGAERDHATVGRGARGTTVHELVLWATSALEKRYAVAPPSDEVHFWN